MPSNFTPSQGLLSPMNDDVRRSPTLDGRPTDDAMTGRVPDLSFLSANFSSESLDNPSGDSPSTPKRNSFGNWANTPVPFSNRRYSMNNSTPTLALSPVGQPSNSQKQRANSNDKSRVRPRSMLVSDTMNSAIWEDSDGPPQADVSANNRHSLYFGSNVMPLAPPADPHGSRSRSRSPARSTSPIRKSNMSPYRKRTSSPTKEPFNFKLQDLLMSHSNSSNLSLVVKPAHRKGHRYKHSSVSMNLFQEPVPIADANLQPDLIPDLYPIPNLKESFTSAGSSQKMKLLLSVAHCAASILVFIFGVKFHQPTFSTLAHLVFYDSLGSLVVACVDIASNFEVWNKSSIAYPFGLGRLEVLTGFALSASLVMVGCDLVSHFVEELVVTFVASASEETIEHGAHHIHGSSEESVNWILYEIVLFFVIGITWITSKIIYDGGNISKMMSETDTSTQGKLAKGRSGGILNDAQNEQSPLLTLITNVFRVLVQNPIRMLTLAYSIFLVFIPLMSQSSDEGSGFDIGEMSTLVVASTLIYAGWNLVKTLGGILLISFPYSEYDYNVLQASITDHILHLSSFKNTCSIENLFLTKANYRLYIGGATVSMKGGSADDESRLLFEINRIFEQSIMKFDKDSRIETTISVNRV